MQTETTSGAAPDAATATIEDPRGEPVAVTSSGEPVEDEQKEGTDGEGAEKEPELTPREKELKDQLEAAQRDKDNAEKAKKSMQRRIDRITREGHQPQQQRAQASQGQDDQELTPEQISQAIAQQANEIAERREMNRRCDQVAAQAEKMDKNFLTNFRELTQETGPMFDQQGRPAPLMEAILDSESPAKVLVHLTENRDLAAEIADMTPRQQIRRIAQLENELEAAAAKEKEPKKPSAAPKPATPVKAVAAGDEPDQNDTARWIEWDRKRDIAKRKG